MKLGLGVCARDEVMTIVATLSSIVRAVSFAPQIDDWRLVICANGCKDGTAEAVAQWITDQADTRISLCFLKEASLVEAQRIIAARLIDEGAGILGFFDADILVAQDCLFHLLETAADENVRAAYAVSVPLSNGRGTLVQRVLDQYDTDTIVFSRRKHLHGRAFLTKEWYIPVVFPPLLADDIYLSCSILSRYGENSIRKSENSRVYFHQIATLSDFYHSYKRRKIELSKCLHIDPSFTKLPADQINRRVIWKALAFEPLEAKVLWTIFFYMRLYCRMRLFIEALIPRRFAVWNSTTSSKKPFDI